MKFAAALAFGFGVVSSAFAQCPSGQIGNPCVDADFTGCTLPFPSSEKLTTTSIGELIQGRSGLASNNLTLLIVADPYVGRTMTDISLNSDHPNCIYPGASFVKGFDHCQDTYTGTFTFQDVVSNCLFTKSSFDATHDAYSGYVKVTTTDAIGQLRTTPVTRTTTSMLSVSLVLPISVDVNVTQLSVASPISLEAAITEQDYDSKTDVATINLKTSVQYPYMITGISKIVNTNGLSTFPSFSSTPDCGKSDCIRDLPFTISPTQVSCGFSGDYTVTLTYGCNPNFPEYAGSNCPVAPGAVASVNITLVSSDTCAKFQVNSKLTTDMQSYSDNTYSVQRIAYVAGQTAFFEITATSSVDILSLTVTDLSFNVQGQANVVVIESGTAIVPSVPVTYSAPTQPSSDKVRFSLALEVGSGKLFDSANADQIFQFDVVAKVSVAYKTTFSKREIVTEELAISTRAVLDASQFKSINMEESSASSMSYAAPLAFAAAGAMFLNL